MSKRTKIIVLILALVTVALVLYFVFRKPKSLPDVVTPPADAAPAQPVANDSFPFDFGTRGDNVRRMQMALNRIKPSEKITEDGIFGTATRSKLLTSVSTQLSKLPMSRAQWLQIIQLGNNA